MSAYVPERLSVGFIDRPIKGVVCSQRAGSGGSNGATLTVPIAGSADGVVLVARRGKINGGRPVTLVAVFPVAAEGFALLLGFN